MISCSSFLFCSIRALSASWYCYNCSLNCMLATLISSIFKDLSLAAPMIFCISWIISYVGLKMGSSISEGNMSCKPFSLFKRSSWSDVLVALVFSCLHAPFCGALPLVPSSLFQALSLFERPLQPSFFVLHPQGAFGIQLLVFLFFYLLESFAFRFSFLLFFS